MIASTGLLRPEGGADPIDDFVESVRAHIESVVEANDPPAETFSFGPLVVSMQIIGDAFRRRLVRPIEFARQPDAGERNSAWRILAIDGNAAGVGAPPYRITSRQHLERVHQSKDRQLNVRYNPNTLTWSACFGASRLAVIWTADAESLPDNDDWSPCRELFHRMLLPTECFLAHAAVIGAGGKGIFLTGPSGSGKSTTTAAAALGGLVTAGDDFVLVDPRPARAYALFNSLKLDMRSAGWFPELAAHAVNADCDPTEKRRIYLSRSRPSAFVARLPINAVLLPHADGAAKTGIVPASSADAMRALVPSTVFLVRGGEVETTRKCTAFLRQMPAYHCSLGSDPRELIDTISAFIAGLSS